MPVLRDERVRHPGSLQSILDFIGLPKENILRSSSDGKSARIVGETAHRDARAHDRGRAPRELLPQSGDRIVSKRMALVFALEDANDVVEENDPVDLFEDFGAIFHFERIFDGGPLDFERAHDKIFEGFSRGPTWSVSRFYLSPAAKQSRLLRAANGSDLRDGSGGDGGHA